MYDKKTRTVLVYVHLRNERKHEFLVKETTKTIVGGFVTDGSMTRVISVTVSGFVAVSVHYLPWILRYSVLGFRAQGLQFPTAGRRVYDRVSG